MAVQGNESRDTREVWIYITHLIRAYGSCCTAFMVTILLEIVTQYHNSMHVRVVYECIYNTTSWRRELDENVVSSYYQQVKPT